MQGITSSCFVSSLQGKSQELAQGVGDGEIMEEESALSINSDCLYQSSLGVPKGSVLGPTSFMTLF